MCDNMKARFRQRKLVVKVLFKLIVIVLIIAVSFGATFKVMYDSIVIDLDNSIYLSYLVNDTFSKFSLSDIVNLSSTEFLLKYSFGIEKFNSGINDISLDTPVVSEVESTSVTNNDALVYIYNSHQAESYRSDFAESFNINNTVYLASYILKEYLEDLGIATIVEENSIVDILNTNGWKYGSSYVASRILLEQAYKENPSLVFFIDLHRDAASYEKTMVEIDGVKYAKVMFVVGLKHENYASNLEVANNLNEKIKEFNEELTRGVLQKGSSGSNGIYNQDFNSNVVLIEIGGQYNYIEEVNNTLKVLADSIYDYFEEYL